MASSLFTFNGLVARVGHMDVAEIERSFAHLCRTFETVANHTAVSPVDRLYGSVRFTGQTNRPHDSKSIVYAAADACASHSRGNS